MEYTKKPLTVDEQIDRLEQRGLNFSDRELAKNYLQNISYYRLRAYTYPFQDNEPFADHEFLEDDIDFNDIIDLYVFDRRLRNIIKQNTTCPRCRQHGCRWKWFHFGGKSQKPIFGHVHPVFSNCNCNSCNRPRQKIR